MTRDGEAKVYYYYTDCCFSPQRARVDSSTSFGEYYMQFYLRRHRAHAVRAVYVCVCCWVLSHVRCLAPAARCTMWSFLQPCVHLVAL